MSANTLPADHALRLRRAWLALDGLSVGDAFGECFFGNPELALRRLEQQQTAPTPWQYTDDTAMALSIYQCLVECGRIDRDRLAELFADEYAKDPWRGYGGTAHSILRAIGAGTPWTEASGDAFSGMGSMGNGGAMRVAPLGAYFADDLDQLVIQARYSAEVTHAHPEGQNGAIAIALAAAWAWNHRDSQESIDPREMLRFVHTRTPEGETHTGIRRAMELPLSRKPEIAAQMLGNGIKVISPDTVPFCLWCAARHCWDYPSALWSTARGFGDVDTTCAIVGGIVALASGEMTIPPEWLAARGHLPIEEPTS